MKSELGTPGFLFTQTCIKCLRCVRLVSNTGNKDMKETCLTSAQQS